MTDLRDTIIRGRTDALTHYYRNKPMYDQIQRQLDRLRETLQDGPTPVLERALFIADVYAIISANAPVDRHEAAFLESYDSHNWNTYHDAIKRHGALYQNNKSDYIMHNLESVDYAHQAELYRNEEWTKLLQCKMNSKKDGGVMGLTGIKGAFSLAMLGVPTMFCADRHTLRYFGVTTDDWYGGKLAHRYLSYVGELLDAEAELASEVTPFLVQWIVFDTQRSGTVTTHDPWFMTMSDELQTPLVA